MTVYLALLAVLFVHSAEFRLAKFVSLTFIFTVSGLKFFVRVETLICAQIRRMARLCGSFLESIKRLLHPCDRVSLFHFTFLWLLFYHSCTFLCLLWAAKSFIVLLFKWSRENEDEEVKFHWHCIGMHELDQWTWFGFCHVPCQCTKCSIWSSVVFLVSALNAAFVPLWCHMSVC